MTTTPTMEVLKPDDPALQAIGGDTYAMLEKAQIDVQITTAHAFPRSMVNFKRRATEMVTLDEETAQSCIFRRPVGKKKNEKTGKWEEEFAEGKSIRMAEIVGACYGNLRVGAILVEQTPRYVKARGMAHDLESNFAASSEVIESTVKASGEPFSERMRMVVAKACLAKARRDATFQVVPGALCKSLEEAARETAIGDISTLGKRRTLAIDWANKRGVDKERVFAALGVGGIDDIGIAELETLTGLKTAIKDKEISIDEAFPPLTQVSDGKRGAAALVAKLKADSPVTSFVPEPKEQAPAQPVSSAPTQAQEPEPAQTPAEHSEAALEAAAAVLFTHAKPANKRLTQNTVLECIRLYGVEKTAEEYGVAMVEVEAAMQEAEMAGSK